jgi:hypothetical protein
MPVCTMNNIHVQPNVCTSQPNTGTQKQRIKRRVIKIAKCTENRLAANAFQLFVFHKDKVLVLRMIRDDALPVAIDTDTEARDDSLQ